MIPVRVRAIAFIHSRWPKLIAMVWLDNGKDLREGPRGPWLTTRCELYRFKSLCNPIIQHCSKAVLISNEVTADYHECRAWLRHWVEATSPCVEVRMDYHSWILSVFLVELDFFSASHAIRWLSALRDRRLECAEKVASSLYIHRNRSSLLLSLFCGISWKLLNHLDKPRGLERRMISLPKICT